MKIMSVFGTRPEAIKMAPLVKELEKRPNIKSIVCLTAQHRDMLDQVIEIFKIKPDYDLNIMKPNQTLSGITTEVITGIDDVIKKEKPDVILVHGDTTTAMAAALAAMNNQVRVGHVEAGLRTYDKNSPFPEEMNRQIIDRIADFLFAPTEESKQNLLDSKININQKITVTGNTAIDALKITVLKDYTDENLEWAKGSRLILLTAHRRENIGKPMEQIFTAINQITEKFPDVKVIYPVHLNPKVREIANAKFANNERVKLIEPLDVLEFHNYMEKAYLIMSDSGGVQEEAPSLGKPVLVLRDTTERPEGIKAGTLKLVGVETENIYNQCSELLTNKESYGKMAQAKNPYGDGFASKYIVDELEKEFNNAK
ncbi:UDP-N-acetylglucosamine 2-epimerase (non-hydrolyzing) [Candidatus Saccharibacteria bacterium]|jgi:UDP-N-acetylglucosamine 2-epimerase|nr:UDP-N-acetylglucosamine 2-epimerase (non-hydrolyzing) [Candidatus Saccharibacteria bacterium]